MEEKRIAEFEAKELRDKYKEGKRNLAFQYEIERNKRNNERTKGKKQELIDLYKDKKNVISVKNGVCFYFI